MGSGIYILLMLAGTTYSGARELDNLKITGTQITLSDSVVHLSLTVEANRKLNRNGATVVFIPQVSDGTNTVCFCPVVIQGSRSQVSWDRHARAAHDSSGYPEAIYIKRGSSAGYQAEVPVQQWMHGAELTAEVLMAGCCSSTVSSMPLATKILAVEIYEPEPVCEPVTEIAEAPVSTFGEEMTGIFPFVLHADEYEPENPLKLYDDEREQGGIIIYYHINSYGIDEDYADNRQTLQNLLAAIDIILQSKESTVSRVFVAGFASPDGPFDFNDRLAWERAVSVKEYILRNSVLEDEFMTPYNGSADWQGLRLLVLADQTMPGRSEVLDIIDSYPVWDNQTNTGRLSSIKELQGGTVWKYMAEHMFPKLRNGAFIRVYYDNK